MDPIMMWHFDKITQQMATVMWPFVIILNATVPQASSPSKWLILTHMHAWHQPWILPSCPIGCFQIANTHDDSCKMLCNYKWGKSDIRTGAYKCLVASEIDSGLISSVMHGDWVCLAAILLIAVSAVVELPNNPSHPPFPHLPLHLADEQLA